jgi:carboxyl-terminal processing protease
VRKRWIVVLVCAFLIVFVAGIGTGMVVQARNSTVLVVSRDSIPEFKLVEDAWNITRDKYVDQTATTPKTLAYGTIAGMVHSLGDTGHSTFLTPDEVKQINQEEQGAIQGIGAEVQEKDGQVIVVAPLDGSPAQKAGIRPGDAILQVNGRVVTGVSQAVGLILGPVGTSVTLTIQDSSGVTRDIAIVRAVIELVDVRWHQLPGSSIVHLRISSFASGASRQLDSALAAIKAQGTTGLILDLRNNPGGLLDEAVSVASRFLPNANVLLLKDSSGKVTPIPVQRGVTVTDLPTVVLVNQGTASGAEIVAGALKDAGRARVIGETTFGTGTVLSQFSLSDGSALVLAIQEWLTPSGRTTWHVGLTPDVTVALAAGVSPLIPESEQGLTNAQLKGSGDQQLLSGLDSLMQK